MAITPGDPTVKFALAVALLTLQAQHAPAADCSLSAIKIKSIRAGFVDRCSRQYCWQMNGVAVLTNGCNDAVGVQVKLVALDKAGAPVASSDFWPASVRNIPPGDYTFSLDHTMQYDKAIKSFTLEAISVKRWRE